MLGKKFLTKNGLFIYMKYVFQARHFYTCDSSKKGTTMFVSCRKKSVQRPANLGSNLQERLARSVQRPANLGSNLQERLALIKNGQIKKSTVTEFKTFTEPNDQEETLAPDNKEIKRPNISSVAGDQILPLKKLTFTERLALRNNKLKIKIDETGKSNAKNIVNNLSYSSASDNNLESNVISNGCNKEQSDDINIGLEQDIASIEELNIKRESSYNIRLQKFENFVKKNEVKSVQNKLDNKKNKLSFAGDFATETSVLEKNVTPLSSKKKSVHDRFLSSKSSKTISNKNLSLKQQINKIISDSNSTTALTDNTSSKASPNIGITHFDSDLEFIENKMQDLTIKDQLDVLNQNQKRILSYNARLESLKTFVCESDGKPLSYSKQFDPFDEQLNYIPVVDRRILKAKKYSQQNRFFTSRGSYDTISDGNNERQPLRNIQINENDSEADCTKDVNHNKTISSNDKIVKLQTKSNDIHLNISASDKTKEALECKHVKLESYSEIQHIHEKFPVPKNILYNYYNILAGQIKDKSSKIDISYKSTKSKQGSVDWTCTYHLKWPENCKVSATGLTKKRASSFAALKCLQLLLESGKMSPDGLPLVYTKEEVGKLTKKKQTEIKFEHDTIMKMQNIIDIFNNNLSPLIKPMDCNEYEEQENKVINEEADSVNLSVVKHPIYIGMHQYLAKEKIELPITKYKESFIDLIRNNNCVIVKGEPGCGKSTRVPQYVLEGWVREASSEDHLCRIAVTQPRRIAAVSLAERVARERDEQVGRIVGYQVRLKSDFQPKTGRILYCTTGILLRHIQSDPNLTKFSHIILDEAHERDVNTDLLMNLLRKAIDVNSNLKVVVMSATIDADAFSEYFEGAPIFNVPGFTYPVTKHFLDGCKLDVTKTLKMCTEEFPRVIHEDVVKILRYIHKNKPEGAILTFLPGWEDLVKVQKLIHAQGDVVVHLVHSKLKDSEQFKIFSKPPPGVRKIILATNIAETSITIDDVVYVVDTGIHKDKIFDNDKGISVIDMEWISQASANQRAGRAGRCAPGESYHLYTREKFDDFQEYSSPKILNSSLTKVVLDSKMYTNNMDACDFMNSLITPPEKFAVRRAVHELKQLELLDENEKLTPLGRTLVNFQLEPNLAKVMVNAVVFKCATPVVDIVTLFSSDTGIFGSLDLTNKDYIKTVKSQFCKSSDHLALMRVYEKWLELCEEEDLAAANRFCRNTNLVPYKLEFLKKLQNIHFGYLNNGLYHSVPISEDFSDNDELVKAVIYSGTGTVLEHRNWDIVKNRLKTNVNVLVTRNNQKATITSESVNYKRQKFPSNFLVYINETRSNIRRTTIVRECSLIPTISVLLFSNKKLEMLEAPTKPDDGDNLVIIGFKNTKLQFLCDKEQANILINCKEVIDTSYKYLIHQLTYAGEEIPEFLEHWNNVLQNLGDILDKFRIDE